MKFTYYGQSCFGVNCNGKNLLFDPFITPNPKASHININQIDADYILVSHGHGDHIADVEALAKATGATLISNFEVGEWFRKKGINKIEAMNLGGKKKFDFGTLKCVNAIHSSVMPDGSNGGNPMGFVIQGENNFYYSGDTALTLDMQLIPSWAKIDFAVMPIGDYFTMDAADAARAATFVNTQRVVGVHYNTFPPITLNTDAAKKIFEENGIELLLPAIGESINI
ncbi:MAG: metal-dependent hydrolase [Chitinophagaceae bacterium]|nr:metal-dependent hydrolase [Bacteroidota bacterium]MCC6258015.1 metal-dependent hydrolase [Chitinophagaceae bacterium]MCW5917611.1 metal-dependent hydrolase [Ferruginibacter sp.]